MTEEQHHLGCASLHQLAPQGDDPRACIQDDRARPRADFHTRGIAPVPDRSGARSRITPAHAPEFDSQFIRHSTPPQPPSTSTANLHRPGSTFIILAANFASRKMFAREVGNISHISSSPPDGSRHLTRRGRYKLEN